MACHDIAWQEYLASLNPGGIDDISDLDTAHLSPDDLDDKWTLAMMKAEGGNYYNTIQLIAKVI